MNQDATMRQLNWDGCKNVRDLGGLPTLDGGSTRWRSVVRADLLGKLTPQGWQAAYADGIRTIIDLRGAEEAAASPYTIQLSSNQLAQISYQNLPVEEFFPHVSARIMQASSRAEVYAIALESYPAATARILRTILHAPPGAVVIHCHAGKDRTGTIAALLLGLVGVPHEIIASDYAESQIHLPAPIRTSALPPSLDPADDFWHQQSATAAMMHWLLNWLQQQYGGASGYISWVGLDTAEMRQLMDRVKG